MEVHPLAWLAAAPAGTLVPTAALSYRPTPANFKNGVKLELWATDEQGFTLAPVVKWSESCAARFILREYARPGFTRAYYWEKIDL